MTKHKLTKSILTAIMASSILLPTFSAEASLTNGEYTERITGIEADDQGTYGTVMSSTGTKNITYDFQKEGATTISIDGGPAIGTANQGIDVDILARKLKLDSQINGINITHKSNLIITADELDMQVDGSGSDYMVSGIATSIQGEGEGDQNRMTIDAKVKMRKDTPNNPWAIYGKSLYGGFDNSGYRGTRWAPVGILVNSSHGSYITIKKPVDLAVKGIAIATDPYYKSAKSVTAQNLATVNLFGGGIIETPRDKNEGYYALASFGGTINVNKGNTLKMGQPDKAVDVKIIGNIIATKEENGSGGTNVYRNGYINIGLVNNKSIWEGVIDNAGGKARAGTINLFLKDGGTWIHKAVGKTNGLDAEHMPDYSRPHYRNYDGVSYANMIAGGVRTESPGIIFQKDKATLDIEKLIGNIKIFYEHTNDGTTSSDFSAGDVKIHNATGATTKPGVIMVTDRKGIDLSNNNKINQTLNNLAGKLYYFKEGSSVDIDAKAEIAEGLTASSMSKILKNISFKENHQGFVEANAENQAPPLTEEDLHEPVADNATSETPAEQPLEFTDPITDRSYGSSQKAYIDAGIKNDKVYTFTKDAILNIKDKAGVFMTGGQAYIINAKNLTINAQNSNENFAPIVLIGSPTLTINAENLNLNPVGSQTLTQAAKITGNAKLIVNGNLHIDMKDATGEQVGLAISGRGDKATIGGFSYEGKKGTSKNSYALKLSEGTVNINKDLNKEVKINGDIFVSTEDNDKAVLNIGLSGEKSYINGAFTYRTDTEEITSTDEFEEETTETKVHKLGDINLTLQNGATWTNKEFDNNQYKAEYKYNGSTLNSFTGNGGMINQNSAKDLTIKMYSGNANVNYTHDAATPTVFAAGNTIINQATPHSAIKLRTDNVGVTDANATQVLSSLAHKLYYMNGVGGNDKNLTGTVEITEGLTASSRALHLGGINFNLTSGQGEYSANTDSAPSTDAPSNEENSSSSADSSSVTGNSAGASSSAGTSTDSGASVNPAVGTGSSTHPTAGGSTTPTSPTITPTPVDPQPTFTGDQSISNPYTLTADEDRRVDYSKGNKHKNPQGNVTTTSVNVAGIYIPDNDRTRYVTKKDAFQLDLNGHTENMEVIGTQITHGILVPANNYLNIVDNSADKHGKLVLKVENKDTRAANGIRMMGRELKIDVPVVIESLTTRGTSLAGISSQNGNSSMEFTKPVEIKNLVASGRRANSKTVQGVNLVGEESSASFKDLLTIENLKGTALATTGGFTTINVAKANISVAEDTNKDKNYNAVDVQKGFVNLGVDVSKNPDKTNKYVLTNEDIIIKGDISSNKTTDKSIVEYSQGKNFRTTAYDAGINLALATKNSKLTGTIKHDEKYTSFGSSLQDDTAGHSEVTAGENRMWLSNGATWDNTILSTTSNASMLEQRNKGISPHKQSEFMGTQLSLLEGGASENTKGYILQNSTKSINIDNYAGHTNVTFKHNSDNPSEIIGGDIRIKHAQEDSQITLDTDNNGINTNDTELIKNVFNNLAGKLYYDNYKNGEHNLTGKLAIKEGLTASATALKLGDITFNQESGQGTYVPKDTNEEENIAPSDNHASDSSDHIDNSVIDHNIIQGKYETDAMLSSRAATVSGIAMPLRIMANDLNKRLGDLHFSPKDMGLWAKIEHSKNTFTNNNLEAHLKYKTVHLGYDRKIDNIIYGIQGSYLQGTSDYNFGNGDISNLVLGLYASKLNKDNTYIDVITKLGRIGNDMNLTINNKDYYGKDRVYGKTLSLEAGKRIYNGKSFVQPEVELTYSHLPAHDFTIMGKNRGDGSMDVHLDAISSLVSRVGLAVGKEYATGSIQGKLSMYHEFNGNTKAIYVGENEKSTNFKDLQGTWFTIGLSATHKLNEYTNIYGEITTGFGSHYKEGLKLSLGGRLQF